MFPEKVDTSTNLSWNEVVEVLGPTQSGRPSPGRIAFSGRLRHRRQPTSTQVGVLLGFVLASAASHGALSEGNIDLRDL